MMRKIAVSVVSALAIAGLVVYVIEIHASPGRTLSGFLAGAVLSFGFLVVRNNFALFLEVLAVSLLAYFSWKWNVTEIAVSGPTGAVVGGLLVWGWISQHKPYSHKEYTIRSETDGNSARREGSQ